MSKSTSNEDETRRRQREFNEQHRRFVQAEKRFLAELFEPPEVEGISHNEVAALLRKRRER